MKRLLVIIGVVGLAASLSAQSVADLAKQEKARREGLKGRRAVVITNADLLRVKKVPAVEVTQPEAEAVTEPTAEGAVMEPAVAPNGPSMVGEAYLAGSGGSLEAQLKSAKDLVDLLSTKMAALRQQLEAQDAMVPGYVIQQQLAETSQKLAQAQAEQTRIEDLIAKNAAAKKAPDGTGR